MKWRENKYKNIWKAEGFSIRAVSLNPVHLVYHVYYNDAYIAYCVTLAAAKTFVRDYYKKNVYKKAK